MLEIMTMPGCKPCAELQAELKQQDVEFTAYLGSEHSCEGSVIKKLMVENEINRVPAVFLNKECLGVGDEAIANLHKIGILKLNTP